MTVKKSYFISLDKQTISPISVPDTTEYEIYVTNVELAEIERLIRANERHDFWFAMRNLMFKPFAEGEVEELREQEDDNLMQVYKLIYHYGTEETREKLASLGFQMR